MKTVRALGLVSGGLDSTLAAKLMLEQGIQVQGINFNTGFCLTDTRRQVWRRRHSLTSLRHEALRAGADLAFPVEIVDVSEEYLQIVTQPRWGYGKNANPCVDCRVMMLRHAKELMSQFDADFVFTGEVLGQRPMTQFRQTLRLIEKQSGLNGLLLRPLSALKLPETEVERLGLVDRSQLRGISGRSRKPQLELAAQFGIVDFPQPAGGCCFLTDPAFALKFFDFLRNKPEEKAVNLEDFLLLKVGRHLRWSERGKIIVGRDEAENNFLENYRAGHWSLRPLELMGPLALMDAESAFEDLEFGARVVARYCDHGASDRITILCESNEDKRALVVTPLETEETAKFIIA